MVKDWIINAFNTVVLFLKNWFSKYAFQNVGWLGGGILAWWWLGLPLVAGACFGIFGEKNRRQLVLAWKDIKKEYLKTKK